MRPHEVLDHQADFAERMKHPTFRSELGRLILNQLETRGVKVEDTLYDILATHARISYSYHVEEHMTDVVFRRAESFSDERAIGSFVPPTEIGFVVLDKPIRHRELRGEYQLGHAIMWSPIHTNMGPSWFISIWNDTVREPDEVYLRLEKAGIAEHGLAKHELARRIMGRWDVTVVHVLPRGTDNHIGPMVIEPNDDQLAQAARQGFTATSGHNTMRLVAALWELMGESVQTASEIPRAWRRRAEKARIPPRVTVIALRRNDHGEPVEPSHIEWQHRWRVRGHLRKITDRQTGEVRYTYVHPHVKGPVDKPIIETRKVYDLKR